MSFSSGRPEEGDKVGGPFGSSINQPGLNMPPDFPEDRSPLPQRQAPYRANLDDTQPKKKKGCGWKVFLLIFVLVALIVGGIAVLNQPSSPPPTPVGAQAVAATASQAAEATFTPTVVVKSNEAATTLGAENTTALWITDTAIAQATAAAVTPTKTGEEIAAGNLHAAETLAAEAATQIADAQAYLGTPNQTAQAIQVKGTVESAVITRTAQAVVATMTQPAQAQVAQENTPIKLWPNETSPVCTIKAGVNAALYDPYGRPGQGEAFHAEADQVKSPGLTPVERQGEWVRVTGTWTGGTDADGTLFGAWINLAEIDCIDLSEVRTTQAQETAQPTPTAESVTTTPNAPLPGSRG